MASLGSEPIAVIGMACRFPGGADSPSKLWELTQSPPNLSKRIPADRFDVTGFSHQNGSHHGASDASHAYFIEEDVHKFDNSFFNIQPAEAEAIDPQQRLVMETVYDSLCDGGQTIEGLRGSNTAVYVGMMCDDWNQLSNRDWDIKPTYGATGESRAIISNRVSYFFDWHGPSMTIDTACSSSLVAVHQAVTALRNGECPVAIAAGANLILAPGMFIAESNLHMLSPTGSSKMWDQAADGYARGEGIASVVLKTLSAALRDGDNIDCIIRGTGVNQDGKTAGLTMPSNIAQAQLIRDTYERAGLDINDPKDRPQFFHAHGTGTQAGDPQEAQAISTAFFGRNKIDEKLLVGSIKTVIGHTEGAAGLASLIGSAMAMKHGMIPPNLHFNKLSARVAPFYTHLKIPTKATTWPAPLPGQPRRVSVNSFGFGGTNSHAILESYEQAAVPKNQNRTSAMRLFSPLTVSAASTSTLRASLEDLRNFLETETDTNLHDLAYTLQARRSTLAFRKPIIAGDAEEAIKVIDNLLTTDNDSLKTRYSDVAGRNILGVFTGQGAQWARMGARLVEQSPFASQRIAELQRALGTLPDGDRPQWTLMSQIMADKNTSRVAEAAISQPLCTAVQIVLVDLLRAANIHFKAVVGHSSGEIAAAYAAGFLSATMAIRVAYYRGMGAQLAGGRGPGSMVAVGTSFEDAREFCELDDFEGRIQVAARNSSSSVTLSGDQDAVMEAVAIFQDEGKFARQLRVDTAYHSRHMDPCAAPYLAVLAKVGYAANEGNGTIWYSSVGQGGRIMTQKDVNNAQYWVDNMAGCVLFEPAVSQAVANSGPFDMVIECGPHPALKGPALDTLEQATGQQTPYTGLLARNKDDVAELASALGYVWTQLGSSSVDFPSFEKLISGGEERKLNQLVLPTYPFDHSRSFNSLTRFSGSHRNVHAPPNPILGRRLVETETSDEIAWRNVLRPSEIKWLSGHGLQGQSVFPAMGFVSLSVEAIAVAAGNREIGLITLKDASISRALAFTDENAGMETKVTLRITHSTDDELSAHITCHSGLPYDTAAPLALNFSATISAALHTPECNTLPSSRVDEINLVQAEPERLYSQLAELGYNYNPPFTGIRSIRRKMSWAVGEIEDEAIGNWEDKLRAHPGWLDSVIQTALAAYNHPHDNRMFTLCVPTSIRSLTINPFFFSADGFSDRGLQYQTSTLPAPMGQMKSDIDVYVGDFEYPFVQFETVTMQPFAAPTPRDDAVIYTRLSWRLAAPDATVAMHDTGVEEKPIVQSEVSAVLSAAERVGFFYLRRLYETVTLAQKAQASPHHQSLLDLAARALGIVSRGDHAYVPQQALKDTPSFIRSLVTKYHNDDFIQLLETTGEGLLNEIHGNSSVAEHSNTAEQYNKFYRQLAAQNGPGTWFARIVAQVAYRFPRMNILEVGGSTGAALTATVLSTFGDAFSTYTYTERSDESFQDARKNFQQFGERVSFTTLDTSQPATEQGFQEASFDTILVSAALHAVTDMEDAISNLRKLLRPAGYLVILEISNNESLGLSTLMGGSPEWWAGVEAADTNRSNGPSLSLEQWDTLTRRHGFGGIDSHTPVDSLHLFSVFVTQAVDNRVTSLRSPLSVLNSKLSADDLVIVGGRTTEVAKLAEVTANILAPRYTNIIQLKSLEELNTLGIKPRSSVISLTELDEQFLEVRTASKIEALKNLWRNGGSILWVSCNARTENPYSSMILGAARVVRSEHPAVNLQILDFDDAARASPDTVAETLVRLELGGQYKKEEGNNLLWHVEPELYHVNGQIQIPRLLAETKANDRYNTYRRAVYDSFDPCEVELVLEPAADNSTFELATIPELRVQAQPSNYGAFYTLQIQRSLLSAIKVGNAGSFHLIVGEDVSTGEQIVGLSDTAVESRLRVPAVWTTRLPAGNSHEDIDAILAAAGTHLLAQTIIAEAPQFGTMLIHEADELLRDMVAMEAAQRGLRVVFTTGIKNDKSGRSQAIFIHEKLSVRQAGEILPRDISYLVDLSLQPSSASFRLISRCVPSRSVPMQAVLADFLSTQAGVSARRSSCEVGSIGSTLRAAWLAGVNRTRVASSSTIQDSVTMLSLGDLAGVSALNSKLSVVNWKGSSPVQAAVRPVDHGTIFRADGSYLLAGLSGELGQSLCKWMVAHGARHIVLTSRRPKVSQQFIDLCAAEGATITAIAMDVTSRKSVRTACDAVNAKLPSIIGVVNGAMLMEDALFDDMTFESLERTCPPKIEGSVILDEFFYDTPLDFFIMFTSMANVVGNTGQSAYVMQNQFMTALAAQRRDVRGVAGSACAISSVLGLGFFEHAGHLDKDHFKKTGYRNVSEQDFHELFAEAMIAGRPGAKGSSEVVTGVSPFRDGLVLLANPSFGHLLIHDAVSAGTSSTGSNERPRALVAAAKSTEEARAIILHAAVERLKKILMIPEGDSLNEKVTLVEQGVDSIMAVEARTWFLQEFEVDLPVLKILGAGSTVGSLVDEVLHGMPADMMSSEKPDGEANKKEAVRAVVEPIPQAPVSKPAPVIPSTVSTPVISEPLPASDSSSAGSPTPPLTATSPSPSPSHLDTPLETPMNDLKTLDLPEKAIKSLERQQEKVWRKAVVARSTELVEPMTFGQRRFWFLSHFISDPTTFNIAYRFKLQGAIRTDDLAKAVESITKRHEALRTRFFWSDDGSKSPMQGILSNSLIRLETASITSELEADKELEAMRKHEWDLGDWVQLRLRLLSLSNTQHYLLMGTHHISMDGHSMNLLMYDIDQAYNRPGHALAPMPDSSQVRAFGTQQVVAHRSGKLRGAINHYRRMFQGMDLTVPVELLSFARSQVRKPLESYDTHEVSIRLEPQVAAQMKQLTRSHRSTSFHGYLTILRALLFRLLSVETTSKMVIGIADANRLDSKFMGSIGNFLNVLPLLFERTASQQTFGQAIEETRQKVYSALEHSALPFDLLLDELNVPRSSSHPPLFQILMDYKLVTKEQAEMVWAGCEASEHRWDPARGPYDIALEILEEPTNTVVTFHMQGALYSREASEIFLRSYVNLLRNVLKHGGDKLAVTELEKWDKNDVKQGVELGKGTELALEWPATIVHRIGQVMTQNPNKIAVKDGFGRVLTYAQLDQRVDGIAQALLEKLPNQDKEQCVVGVFQTPSTEWIASLIAILRVGAVYLPLDLKVSTSRLRDYVDTARPRVILADATTVGQVGEIGIDNDSRIQVVDVSGIKSSSSRTVATVAQQDRPAYIIFTSGSTGKPKGVVVSHASARAMAEGYTREWDMATQARVVLQQFAFTSDGSLKQIWSTITTGACLFVAPADARGDPTELTRLMAEHDVNVTMATPSEYSMWFRFAPENLRRCTSWTSVWFGGERAPQSLLDSFRELGKTLPNLRFFTTYGPTEATVSTAKGAVDIHDPNLVVPVPGRVLPNYAVYILDEELQPVPAGVPGEIFIGGAGVGKNHYLDRPDLTEKAFLVDPFAPSDKKANGWGRMYRTGDYGRLDARGMLAVEGRVSGDAQVKVRGFRVELAEIESAVLRESERAVSNVVVTLRDGQGDHDGLLVAHVVLDQDKTKTQVNVFLNQLRSRLSQSLPQYMVPAIIVPVADLPLTANGKTDRKAVQALPLPQIDEPSAAEKQELQKSFTDAERRMADLWAAVLPARSLAAEPLTQRSNFFVSGGNSLLLVKLQSEIKREFGDAPRLNTLMNTSDLDSMAALLEGQSVIDWNRETAFDLADLDRVVSQKSKDGGLHILLTGATGSLGKVTVSQLAANEQIAQITILARPAPSRELNELFSELNNSKVRVLPAELPSLPAEADLSDIDVILHCAADRNFWDGYTALKPVNVESTKALTKLALRIGAQLHVLSSGSLAAYEADGTDKTLPRPDPAHGYVASKWVAERYLAGAAQQTGLPITAHRPTQNPIPILPGTPLTSTEEALIRSCIVNSPLIGARPDFTGLAGEFHIAPVADVAASIISTITNTNNPQTHKHLQVINYPGTATIRADTTSVYANELFHQPENEDFMQLPAVPALHWVGMAKRAGLFEWFITSQELIVVDEEGQKVISRR
ncbi:BcPKS5, polyketide synthase [Xylaria venustula]|nr:BcPKS5, polyketide synthase [Xylaria venustula]